MATAITLTGTNGLFTILNEIFLVQTQIDACDGADRSSWDTLEGARGSQFSNAAWTAAVSAAEASMAAQEASPSSLMLTLQAMAQQAVIKMADDAVNLVSADLDSALIELVTEMQEDNVTLLAPTVAVTAASDAGNTGDMFCVATKRRVNGKDNHQQFAETIQMVCSTGSGQPQISITSNAAKNVLASGGMGGSGLSGYVNYFSTATGLNGSSGLNAFTTSASTLPGNWIANVGTLGTTISSGQPQVATIVITGTATSGTYRIQCTTTNLGTQSTITLPYNATASQIQSAIAAMTGYSGVVVTATGSSPDYTHTIKFYGMRESVTVAVVNSTNTGSFSVTSATVAYATPSLGSSPIILASDGSSLLSVSHQLTHLLPNRAYAVNVWAAVSASASAGVLEVSLTNGVGGSIIQDDAGNNLSYTVAYSSLTTSLQALAKLTSGVPIFMTPKTLPASVYLRIRQSTAFTSTKSVYLENPVVGLATQAYVGGPFFALFAGPTGPQNTDIWTITTTNDWGGKTSWMMERNFNLRARGLAIPHAASSPTITELVPEVGVGGP